MRKFWIAACVALFLAGCGGGKKADSVSEPGAKKPYTEFSEAKPTQAAAGTVEVREFFWYACPHCYRLKEPLEAWLKGPNAKNVTHIRQAVPLAPNWTPMSRAYHSMILAGGFDPQLHDAFFIAWHVAKKNINAEEDTYKVVEAIKGADYRKKFESAYKSPAVDEKVKQEMMLAKAYGVESTPTVIVAGKYLVNGVLAEGEEKIPAVVEMLVKRELAKAPGAKK